jgi:FlgD Ig-like domain
VHNGIRAGEGTQKVHREGTLEMTTIPNRKAENIRIAVSLLFGLLLTNSATAANSLNLIRTSASSIAVRLDNSDPVAGLQFTVSGSAGLLLTSFDKGIRVSSGGWLVDWNRVSDSTINVVVLAPANGSLPSGSGVIAEISVKESGIAADVDYLTLKNVVAVDQNASYIVVNPLGLAWPRENKWFVLHPNFPNPFNPSTVISFRLLKSAPVRLSVYDVTGRIIRTLFDGIESAGDVRFGWDSTNDHGTPVSSGVYFAHLQVDQQSTTQRLILAK